MTTESNIILDTIQINQKIKRIAYQIYENNTTEKEVIIAGIIVERKKPDIIIFIKYVSFSFETLSILNDEEFLKDEIKL